MRSFLNLFIIFCFLAFNQSLFAHTITKKELIQISPRVIYGIDDREDVFESSDSLMKELSKSVAAQILTTHFDALLGQGSLDYVLGNKTLRDEGMCSTERFVDQPAEANCSGFLIGADILVTAGHCVRDASQCANHFWVFDYANRDSVQVGAFHFDNDQVYKCTGVLSRVKEDGAGNDYAVLKLDRKVLGRKPLKIRKSGKVSNDAVLTVFGFPSGIPLKITTGATIRDNSNSVFFTMNSDTYGGNSGSAVVDTRTGIVEGILVRGDTDYMQEEGQECYSSVKREENFGRGEDATRITAIKLK
jgi:V8-like Glu-specific endopeptidase